MNYSVAVVGASGSVGREILDILVQRQFPIDKLYALSSNKSHGKTLHYAHNREIVCQDLAQFDFKQVDIVLSSAGAKVSADFAPHAAAHSVVIDNTSYFRNHQDVPLIVPEINKSQLHLYRQRNIIANPNCSTIIMLTALAPLHQAVPIKRIVATTYQSVSGAGKNAAEELFSQTRHVYTNQTIKYDHFPKQIAFNVIPQIDVFLDDASTKEEWKMSMETKKILDENIQVTSTCVRVPVFVGHALALNVQFSDTLSVQDAQNILRQQSKSLYLHDYHTDDGYVTPKECEGEDLVYVSRVRQDHTQDNTLWLWVVGDNLRKGAALNTVQIAEELINLWHK